MSNIKPLVIFHKNCTDGMAAAWCFWKSFGDKMEYHPGTYGEAIPDVYDRTVYMVDFSYKRDVMEDILKFSGDVVLLDHHKSALEDLEPMRDLPGFDMSHSTLSMSGAAIAWDYVKKKLRHKRTVPPVLLYIQDRDLWKHELPDSRAIMASVMSYPVTLESYDELMSAGAKDLRRLRAEGVSILRAYGKQLLSNIAQCTRIEFIGGYGVPVANLNGHFASDAGNLMSAGHAFAATYYDTDSHRCFSLRSQKEGIDVSEIAATFGGGGHKHAAGFKVPREHDLAKI